MLWVGTHCLSTGTFREMKLNQAMLPAAPPLPGSGNVWSGPQGRLGGAWIWELGCFGAVLRSPGVTSSSNMVCTRA